MTVYKTLVSSNYIEVVTNVNVFKRGGIYTIFMHRLQRNLMPHVKVNRHLRTHGQNYGCYYISLDLLTGCLYLPSISDR